MEESVFLNPLPSEQNSMPSHAMPGPLAPYVVSPETSIAEAVLQLDASGIGALAICAPGLRLCGFLTDGDLRRAVLHASSPKAACQSIATARPIVGPPGLTPVEALQLMNRHDIDHLPIVDEQGVLLALLLRRDLVTQEDLAAGAGALLASVRLSASASIAEAIAQLDKAGTGGLVLCAEDGTLAGLLTDGDIRRAILRGLPLDTACGEIATREPLTLKRPVGAAEALEIMARQDINHLPVVDASGRVTDLLLRKNLAPGRSLPLAAVIMAGGHGKRLLPLTEQVPKPMLPVGDKPLLERTIQQLRRSGICDIRLTTHYLPEHIVQYFGDGSAFGVRLQYLNEERPLGTAGGLRPMQGSDTPFLVLNGDILTGVPFEEMLHFHRRHHAALTVGVRKFEVGVPFGVVDLDEVHVRHIREKPSFHFFINAGLYLLEPEICDLIPDGQPFDMPELIEAVIHSGRPVVSFPIMEYWLDVGRHEDYARAQEDARNGMF